MAAPVAGFGLSRGGRSTSAAEVSQQWQPGSPEDNAQQDGETRRNGRASSSTAATTGATSSSTCPWSSLVGGTADGTASAFGRPVVCAIPAATLSSAVSVAPASCPAPAAPRGAAPYAAALGPVAAPAACPLPGAAYGLNAASTCRESQASVEFDAVHYGISAVAAAMNGTPPPAIPHRGVGGLVTPAVTIAAAPSSAASGSPCGRRGRHSLLTYAERNAGAYPDPVSHAAAVDAPLNAALSLRGASVIPQQHPDHLFSPIAAEHAAAANPGQSAFSCTRLPPLGSSSRGVLVTGNGTQQTAAALPCLASQADSLCEGSAGAPMYRPSVFPITCSSPLPFPPTFPLGRSNCRRRTVDLSFADAAGQTVGALGFAPDAGLHPSTPYTGATRATGHAHPYAKAAAARGAPACSPSTVSRAPVAHRNSTSAVEPFAGSSAADAGAPRLDCPSSLPARSSACATSNPAATGGTAMAASGAPPAVTAAVRGASNVVTVGDGAIPAVPLQRDSHGYTASSVLLRETISAPAEKVQQRELLGCNQAAAAGRGSFAAGLQDSVHSISRCSRDAVAAVSAACGVASHPALPSASAGDGVTCPTPVPTSRAVAAGEFVGTSRGDVSAHEFSQQVKQSTMNFSSGVQTLSSASGAPAPRSVLRGQPEVLQKTARDAYSVLGAGRPTAASSKTAAVGNISGTAGTAATSNLAAAGDLRTAAAVVAAAGRVAASNGEPTGRGSTSLAGSSANAALRSNCAAGTAAALPAAAGFLQRTKRVPRENPRPSRRVLPYEMIFNPVGLCPGVPTRSGGSDSRFPSKNSSVSSAAAQCVPSAPGAPAAPLAGRGDSGAAAVSPAAVPENHQAKARAVYMDLSHRLRSEAAGAGAAFRTPQQQQRPPWRALTPQQLVLQRASKKRLHAGNGSGSQPFPCYTKPPSTAATSLKESNHANAKHARTIARAETTPARVIAPATAGAVRPASVQAEKLPAATDAVPSAVCEAAPAVGLPQGAVGAAKTSGRSTAEGGAAGQGEAPASVRTAAAAASDSHVVPAEADSCRRSSPGALTSAPEGAEPCKSTARRTRKPSRLSLEAAETYSLSLSFKQQRRTSGRTTRERPAAHLQAAASCPSSKRIKSDTAGCLLVPSSSAAAPQEMQRQTQRHSASRTRRIRAESSPKKRPGQLRQHQQQSRQQQSGQQQEEEDRTQLTSSQEQEAATYAAALQRQPVYLESCSFMVYPPGFASSPAAVRRVCLPGTLQQPVYVPSAASLSSVQQTVKRQQQEAVAISKCRVNVCPITEEVHTAGAFNSNGSKVATSSGRRIDKGSSKVDTSSAAGSDAGVCKDSFSSERSRGSVVRFIENTTVSGYLYHWYARMHVSAQLETQLQQLLAARQRLAQQLCDGSELHSNLFFFSLFPQDYGLEQFRRNLRFFPQYAVAAAAAEAAGLRPLEFYGDNSCTAAIAETTRRAKLMEELYEEEQLLQQRRRLAKAAARSQKQQQCKQLQQPQQHHVMQKAGGADKAPQHKVDTQQFPQRPLASAAAAAKLGQQGTLRRTMEKTEGKSVNQVALPEVTTGDALSSCKNATSLPEQRVSCDVEGCKQEEAADRFDSDAAEYQAAAHAAAVVQNVTESSCDSPTPVVSCVVSVHPSAPGSSTATPSETGVSSISDSTVETIPIQKGASCAHGNSEVTAARAREETIDSVATGTLRNGVEFTAHAVLTEQPSHLNGSREKCQQTDEVDQQTQSSEQLQQDVGVTAERRASVMSPCISSNHTAVSAVAAQDATQTGAAADVQRAGADTEEDTRVLRRKLAQSVLEKDGIQAKAMPAVTSDLSDGSHKYERSTECERDSENSPAAKSVSNTDAVEGVTPLNGCCTSKQTGLQVMCRSTTTEIRGDTNGNSHSDGSSTCDSSRCDSGSSSCAASDSSHNSTTSSSNNNSSCTGGDDKEKITDMRRSSEIEGKLQSCTSRDTDSRSTATAVRGVGLGSGRLSNSNTSTSTSSKFGSGCSGLGCDHDNAPVDRSVEDRRSADKSHGSVPASTSFTQAADGIKGRGGRTAGSVCRRPVPAAPARAETPSAGKGRSSRGDRNCRRGGSSSDDSGKAESVAEARYFPVIPRVGTVEIASMWRLIETSEQLLLELHQRQEQGKPPQQLEEQLPALVKTLPVWWMGSVDLGMQQQLAALTLHRVLPGLAAWQGRDLRLIGSALPFAARGLLALALCQLEHRIALLQQQLAAAVGGLQVLMASVLLLQQVEQHYAPPLYSLPQHVLACLYSRGGGRAVVKSPTRERSAAGGGSVELHRVTTANPAMDGSSAGHRGETGGLSSDSHEAGHDEREWGPPEQADSEQKKLFSKPTPSWEAGIRQGAPVTVEGFVSYTDAFEDYLPTLGREEATLASILGSDSEDAVSAPAAGRTMPHMVQKRSRTRAVIRSASKVKKPLEPGTAKGRRKKFADKRGDTCTKDTSRKSGNSCRKAGAAQLQVNGAK